jgi:fumarate hydratase subunit alpha
MNREIIIENVKNAVIDAANTFTGAQKELYKDYLSNETLPRAKWILEQTIQNQEVANKMSFNMCDDTGIPHLMLEVGPGANITYELLESIQEGVAMGLRTIPARPMAVLGNDIERIEQSKGLSTDPGDLIAAPIFINKVEKEGVTLHILLQGGGPEIRAKTFRVFHKRNIDNIIDTIVEWAIEGTKVLGCSPVVPAIGIGRTHYEATSLMLQAMIYGKFDQQSKYEKEITKRLNETNIGPLGLNGDTTALATFMRVGPQRASGVRIVSLRLCCSIEPRHASLKLQ